MKSTLLSDLEWVDRFSYKKAIPFETDGHTKYQIVRFEPHTSIEPHYHLLTQEVFVTTEGYGLLIVDSKPYALAPGTAHLIEPHDSHAIYAQDQGLTIHIFKPIEAPDDIYWGQYAR